MTQDTSGTRVLRALALPRTFDAAADSTERRLGLYVDCETTGAETRAELERLVLPAPVRRLPWDAPP